jgi:NADH:ubiquinone oxidoreductase subunit 4 (subunit M)
MLALFLLNKENTKIIKATALAFSLATFIYSIVLILDFDSANPDFQYYFEAI